MKEPKQETYLAAELALVMGHPGQAAHRAMELCAIGRQFKRMAERLCGGEEEWGAWSSQVEAAQERAYAAQGKRIARCRALVAGLSVNIQQSDLTLKCVTSVGRGRNRRELVTVLL